MSSSSFFLLSFAGPIFAGGTISTLAWLASDWLRNHKVPPLPLILVAFIVTWIVTRKLIHSFVSVECPKCKKKTAFEMEGIACRFRCTVCWREF